MCVYVFESLPTLCIEQVYCQGPVHPYDPRNFDDSAASEYGGYTTAELRLLFNVRCLEYNRALSMWSSTECIVCSIVNLFIWTQYLFKIT